MPVFSLFLIMYVDIIIVDHIHPSNINYGSTASLILNKNHKKTYKNTSYNKKLNMIRSYIFINTYR